MCNITLSYSDLQGMVKVKSYKKQGQTFRSRSLSQKLRYGMNVLSNGMPNLLVASN